MTSNVPTWVIGAAGGLYLSAAVVFVARGRSRDRAEQIRRITAVRQDALARYRAGMPAGHPEQIRPLSVFEQAWNDDFYDFVRAQLADINADTSGGAE